MATSRRAALRRLVAVSLARSSERRSAVDVFRLASCRRARRPRSRGCAGRDRRAAAAQRRGVLLADRRQRADRGGADAGVAVAEHAADVRHPLLGDVAAHGPPAPTARAAHVRRLVIEQQRRDEVALVERFEHVDRVDDALRIGMRSSWTSVSIVVRSADVQAQLAPALTSRARCCGGTTAGIRAWRERHDDPQRRSGQADVAELLPRRAQPHGLMSTSSISAPSAARQPIDRDVDERLCTSCAVAGSGRKQISRVVLSTV